MPRVKNLETGLEHDVPDGHFSIESGDYEVVDDGKAKPAAEKAATPSSPSKRKGGKKAR